MCMLIPILAIATGMQMRQMFGLQNKDNSAQENAAKVSDCKMRTHKFQTPSLGGK